MSSPSASAMWPEYTRAKVRTPNVFHCSHRSSALGTAGGSPRVYELRSQLEAPKPDQAVGNGDVPERQHSGRGLLERERRHLHRGARAPRFLKQVTKRRRESNASRQDGSAIVLAMSSISPEVGLARQEVSVVEPDLGDPGPVGVTDRVCR